RDAARTEFLSPLPRNAGLSASALRPPGKGTRIRSFLHYRSCQNEARLSHGSEVAGQEQKMKLPTYADVVAAAPVVHRYLKPTPLYEWPALSALLGCRYFLKHENHTPTTAFKVRGGIYLVSRLSDEQK